MKRVAWLTDIHLDCVPNREETIYRLCDDVDKANAEEVIITGDISTSRQIRADLALMEQHLQRPISYVCGNHDYYFGEIETVRKQLHEQVRSSTFLRYLHMSGPVNLTPNTMLVGADGWYDCRNGNVNQSNFFMNDWYKISNFAEVWQEKMKYQGPGEALRPIAEALALESAHRIADGIKVAARSAKNIIVATHVPPFVEAAYYHGVRTEPSYLPWYTNAIGGDTLRRAAAAYPDHRFTVLSGHTHGLADEKILPNLVAKVGFADYGDPRMQPILIVN